MTVALGEVDPSYLWDGAQEGWKLEASEAEIRLTLHVGKPLGELPADQLDALREILGDARYNHLSTSQTEVLVLFKADRVEARRTHDALHTAGFDAETVERSSYQVVREFAGRRSALLVESEADHERIVNRMIEARVRWLSKRLLNLWRSVPRGIARIGPSAIACIVQDGGVESDAVGLRRTLPTAPLRWWSLGCTIASGQEGLARAPARLRSEAMLDSSIVSTVARPHHGPDDFTSSPRMPLRGHPFASAWSFAKRRPFARTRRTTRLRPSS